MRTSRVPTSPIDSAVAATNQERVAREKRQVELLEAVLGELKIISATLIARSQESRRPGTVSARS